MIYKIYDIYKGVGDETVSIGAFEKKMHKLDKWMESKRYYFFRIDQKNKVMIIKNKILAVSISYELLVYASFEYICEHMELKLEMWRKFNNDI